MTEIEIGSETGSEIGSFVLESVVSCLVVSVVSIHLPTVCMTKLCHLPDTLTPLHTHTTPHDHTTPHAYTTPHHTLHHMLPLQPTTTAASSATAPSDSSGFGFMGAAGMLLNISVYVQSMFSVKFSRSH